MNEIKEIKDEPQENSVKDEPLSDLVTETREDGLKEEKMNTSTDNVMHTDLQDHHGEEDTSTKHRKSKKHKKQKSKKKRKKRKEGKDSSSDTESDKEIQESGKKKKRKKKKKSKDADKVKRSGSRSESSSASGSESESELKPSNENTKSSSADKTSKSELRNTSGVDKDQLLEIAKANAAAMCTKAGVPIPESLRPKAVLQLPLPTLNSTFLSLYLPMMSNMTMNAAMASMTAATMTAALSSMGALSSLPQMAPLPTILNKPPSTTTQNLASIEEAKKKVTKQANSFNIKELTERCKKITENKEEMAIAKPHVSDDEEDERLFGASLKENKGITFSLSNTSIKPSVQTEATFAKEFLVFPGSRHKNKEADGGYGEWLPVKKKTVKPSASGSSRTVDIYSVFPKAPSRPVDITLAVSERAVAQKKLAENSSDINAMCILNRAQEQVDALAQSNTIPGLCTGSAGAQVLSSDELSNSGPQAWIKKVKP
ncbi:hypothetical protein cypCar_00009348 [Cyprinus carpio]|nr:hypothetical protein cypCar_00009348 [Cyprinus carpio]